MGRLHDKQQQQHRSNHHETLASLVRPCARMPKTRLSQKVLFSELATRVRPRGWSLRWCKDQLKTAQINPRTWETAAGERTNWHQTIKARFLRFLRRKGSGGTRRNVNFHHSHAHTSIQQSDLLAFCDTTCNDKEIWNPQTHELKATRMTALLLFLIYVCQPLNEYSSLIEPLVGLYILSELRI